MTVLEAVLKVLREAKRPMAAREIHSRIVAEKMYAFIAQDEVGIIRNAIRRHLRAASLGTVTAQVREIERDKFVVASAA